MPLINKDPKRMGNLVVTEFVDSVGVDPVTFSIPDNIEQEMLQIYNISPIELLVSVGTQSNVSVPPYRGVTLNETFTSFSIKSSLGVGGFRATCSYEDSDEEDEVILGDRINQLTTSLAQKATNTYAEKIHVCFGDSIIGLGTIPAKLAELMKATVHNVGFAGCQLTTTTGNYGQFSMEAIARAIVSRDFSAQDATGLFGDKLPLLKSIDFNAVYSVSIAFGTNDYSSNKAIGNDTDTDATTIKGAINFVTKTLLQAYPHLKISFVTPIYRNRLNSDGDGLNSDDFPNNNGNYLKDYSEAFQTVCAINKVHCIDLYHCGINRYNAGLYLSDGLHPNPTGDEVIAKFYHRSLNSISNNSETKLTKNEAQTLYSKPRLGNLITDSEYDTIHYPENKVTTINGVRYLTNVSTSTAKNVILARTTGWGLDITDYLVLKGKLMASYTGNVRVDVTYYYKVPASIAADLVEKSITIPVTANTEIDLNLLLQPRSPVDPNLVLQTDIKILNLSSGSVYVRNCTLRKLGEFDVVTALTETGTMASGWTVVSFDKFKYKAVNRSTVFIKGSINCTAFDSATMNVIHYPLITGLPFKTTEDLNILGYYRKGNLPALYPALLCIRTNNTITVPLADTFTNGDNITLYFSHTIGTAAM